MACRPALVWGGILAAGVIAELHAVACDHHNCTLSALTRAVFRTEHPAGRIAFILGTAALAVWFEHHILTWKQRELDLEAPPVLALVGGERHRRTTRPAPRVRRQSTA